MIQRFITYSIFIVALLSSKDGFAQEFGRISGQVLDSNTNIPIEFAQIKLFNADSVVITGVYTDSLGNFQFENLQNAMYSLSISGIGYNIKTIPNITLDDAQIIRDLGSIGIKINAISLDEVQITAQQDLLQAGIDKKVYNVGEDLTAKNGSVNDVLNNIPSIQVDQDGNISLRGDANVTILIDGRPSSLASGSAGLSAIPASSIERIEIVTNPSARYDPDGTSGIINIVLKKNKLKGFNGLLNASLGTGNLYNFNGALSYRNQKFNVYTNYGIQYREGFRNNFGDIIRTFEDSVVTLEQDRIGTDLEYSHTLRLGSDFYLNTRNTMGISVTGNFEQRDRTGNLENKLSYNDGILLRRWDRMSLDPSDRLNGDLNAFYQHDLKENKGSFIMAGTQSYGTEDTEGFYDEIYLDENEESLGLEELNQRLFNEEVNAISTIQADYVRNTTFKARYEFGAKAIVRNQFVDTYSERRDTLSNEFIPDTLANFNYEYKERIYSVYGIYGQNFKKLNLQVGIRGENAYQIPNLVSTNEKFVNNYLNLFPSGHIKYQYNKNLELGLSYSRRVNRASSRTLNPFTSYADPFNLRRGNPELQPEYINSLDLSSVYSYKDFSFSSSIFYRLTTDVIQRIKEFYPDNTAAVTYQNIDKSTSVGIEAILIWKLFKVWKSTLSLNGTDIRYEDSEIVNETNTGGFNYEIKYNSSIEFWKKTATFQVNARYFSPRQTAQGIVRPRSSMDLAVEKSLQNKKWSFGLRLTDVFNTQGFYYEVDLVDVQQTSEFKWLTRRLIFNVSYKFGKLEMGKDKNQSREDGGGGTDF